MDIHRCRFVPYQPPSISALAFSHASDLSRKVPRTLRLALGRENGDIELWNPSGGRWAQETVLRGSRESTVEQLAWTQDVEVEEDGTKSIAKQGRLRLFSIGGSSAISEWSLTSGSRSKQADGNFGDIWCFAAQPAYSIPASGDVGGPVPSQLLAAGTNNGSIVLFSTEDNDLRYQQILHAPASKNSKILSIAWRDRNTVVAGYEGSLIRVIDVTTRTVIRQMSLGKGADGARCVVWTVKCLPDGTILSGDSSGELKIWDAENLSLAQRLKTHQADILDITASSNGDQIFTFGVDRRTVAYQLLPLQPGQQKRRRWAQAMHRRFHDHDVKCATSYESKGFSVLVSGGMDATPVVLPMRNWQSEYHRTLSHLPQRPQVSASRTRLLLAWWGTEMYVYLLPPRSGDGFSTSDLEDYELLATLQLKDDHNIQSAQISRDGNYIIAATVKSVRLFQLRRSTSNGSNTLRSRLVALPTTFENYGAQHVGFSPNGCWTYAVRFNGTVLLAKIQTDADTKRPPIIHPKIARLSAQEDENEHQPLGSYTNQIATAAFSTDSRVFAVGSLSGHITAWTLEGHEDLTSTLSSSASNSSSSSSSDSSDSDDEEDSPLIHAQQWKRTPAFPRLDSALLALCFRQTPVSSSTSSTAHPPHSPARTNVALHPTRHNPHPLAHEHPLPTTLLALTTTHTLTELSLQTGKLTSWSRRNPSTLLPTRFQQIKDRALSMFYHSATSRLWLYGPSWLYMLDLSQDFPTPSTQPPTTNTPTTAPSSKKRKRGTGAGDVIHNRRDRTGPLAAPTGVRYTGTEGAMEIIPLETTLPPDSDDERAGVNDDKASKQLIQLRRGEEGGAVQPASNTPASHTAEKTGDSTMHDFGTFRYRAIFGIAVLSAGTEDTVSESSKPNGTQTNGDVAMTDPNNNDMSSKDGNGGLEVVIIERPMYDVPQSARFDGAQDWDA